MEPSDSDKWRQTPHEDPQQSTNREPERTPGAGHQHPSQEPGAEAPQRGSTRPEYPEPSQYPPQEAGGTRPAIGGYAGAPPYYPGGYTGSNAPYPPQQAQPQTGYGPPTYPAAQPPYPGGPYPSGTPPTQPPSRSNPWLIVAIVLAVVILILLAILVFNLLRPGGATTGTPTPTPVPTATLAPTATATAQPTPTSTSQVAPQLTVRTDQTTASCASGVSIPVTVQNTGGGSLTWQATTPTGISATPVSGTLPANQIVTVQITGIYTASSTLSVAFSGGGAVQRVNFSCV